MSSGGRGQLLMPWPNRIRDGRYTFGGRELQLALTEPKRSNASHGLARWVAWTLEEHTANSVSLVHRRDGAERLPVGGRPARPLRPRRRRADGDADRDQPQRRARAVRLRGAPLPVRRRGRSTTSSSPCPRATRTLTDDRLIPVETVPVEDEHDFRTPRPIGDDRLRRRRSATCRATRASPPPRCGTPRPATGWRCGWTSGISWLLLYTADDAPGLERRSLAVEPMTAPADAFNSGTDLVTLAPGRRAGRRALGVLGHPGARPHRRQVEGLSGR